MDNSGSSNRVRKPYCKKLKFATPKPSGVPSADLVDFLGVEWMSQLERCESLMECMSTPNNDTAAPTFEPIAANFDENAQPFFNPVKDIPMEALMPHEMPYSTPVNDIELIS